MAWRAKSTCDGSKYLRCIDPSLERKTAAIAGGAPNDDWKILSINPKCESANMDESVKLAPVMYAAEISTTPEIKSKL